MQQQKWIAFILRYFDFWGFCSEYQTTKKHNDCYLLILILHILLVFYTGCTIVVYLKQHAEDTLGHVNDVIKLGSILFVWFLSVVESYCKRNRQRYFWNIFQQIKGGHCQSNERTNIYLWKFSFFIVTSIISIVYFTLDHYSIFIDNWQFWIMYDIMTKMYQHRVLYYLLYLDLIENELNEIERMSKDCSDNNRSKVYGIAKKRNQRIKNDGYELKTIYEYYRKIRELINELNIVFGWSNAFTMPFSFALILTEINWVYWIWYNRDTSAQMIS